MHVLHFDGNESIVKQGVSRFHGLQSCTHAICGYSVDKLAATAGYEEFVQQQRFLAIQVIR
jgi:hypothetical protein